MFCISSSPLNEIEERNPNVPVFDLVVQNQKKTELKAAIGRKRPVEPKNADTVTNRASTSTQSLEQALSRTTDFGSNFLKTQVNKKRDLNEACGVVIHDYGPQYYNLNGAPFVKSISQKSLEKGKQYANSKTLVEGIPVILNEKPTWANVR
jgi:hypothetical protein